MIKYDLQKAFTFIEPGPCTLITTNDGKKNNIFTISWTMMLDFSPNCHIAIMTGEWNHSFSTMMKTKECVICIPPASLAETAVKIGMVSGKDVDKFAEFSLTAEPAAKVAAPLIVECIACLECEVVDYIEKYGIVILRCVELWCDPAKEFLPSFHANGDGTFIVDSDKVLNYRELMRPKFPAGCERF